MAPFSALLLLIALASSFAAAAAVSYAVVSLTAVERAELRALACARLHGLAVRAMRLPPVEQVVTRRRQARRQALFERQMPDALRSLCIALDAGSSLVKALEYAADSAEEPLHAELKRTVWDLQVGQGFDEAMANLRGRTGGAEFAYLAVVMEVQHRCGGSLTDVLETISGSLRGAADLHERLQTQTAQGRLSARIVALMPLVILGVFSLLTPTYLLSFVSSPVGVLMLLLALLLEAVGVVWARRALAIDLSASPGGA